MFFKPSERLWTTLVLLILLKPLHIPSWTMSSIFQQPTFVLGLQYIFIIQIYKYLYVNHFFFLFFSNEMRPLFHFSRKDTLYPCVEDLILNNTLRHLARNQRCVGAIFSNHCYPIMFSKIVKIYSLQRLFINKIIHSISLLSLSYPAKFHNLMKLTIDRQISLPICKDTKYFHSSLFAWLLNFN